MLNGHNLYKCIQCGKIMRRYSKKKWIKSFCERKGITVHLKLQSKDVVPQNEVKLGTYTH